jgi:hypothetical protein
MSLKYHQATFDLLSSLEKPIYDELEPLGSICLEAIVSDTLLHSLNQVEQKCNIILPPSVKEWYSIQSAVDIIDSCICCNEFHSPDDWCKIKPVPKEWELRQAWLRGADYKKSQGWLQEFTQEFTRKGFLMILSEEQAVSHWAIKLNEQLDDPPVWMEFDSSPDYVWQKYTHTFSDFIYEQVWNFVRFPHKLTLLGYTSESINLTHLNKLFSASPPVCLNFDSKKTFRFHYDDQGISIEEKKNHLLWNLSATSPTSLLKLASKIWTLGYRLNYISVPKADSMPPELAHNVTLAHEAFANIKLSGKLVQEVSQDDYRQTFFGDEEGNVAF